MRKLSKIERALLAAVASAGTAVIFKTLDLIKMKKDNIITDAASNVDLDFKEENRAEETSEENLEKKVDTDAIV